VKIGQWLEDAYRSLSTLEVDNAALEARILLAVAMGTDRASNLLRGTEWALTDEEFHRANSLVERRKKGEPIAYIRGSQEFYGREFLISRDVLIPRPETELLVESLLKNIEPGATCIDVGTGSGCIAVTCLLEMPETTWVAGDISGSALMVARWNSATFDAAVHLVLGDMLAWARPNAFDVVVSNPPYVSPDDPQLDPMVREWEPALALFSENGISGIESLIRGSGVVLKPGGLLAFEFGFGQVEQVAALLSDWEFDVKKDLQGIERFVLARK
jgi:release factor glutamine methyltransferase